MDFLPPPSAAPDPARRPVSVPVDVPLPVLPALAAIPALPLALPAMGVPGLVADGARGQLAAGGAPSPHAASAPSAAGPSPAFAGLLAGTRPRTVGVRRSGPVGRPAGAQAVRDHRVPAVSQHPLVGPAAGARGGTGGRRAAGTPLHGSRVAGSRPPRPIDAGWLAACLGLVAAAMLLGRPPGPTAGVRRAWTFLAAARPSSERG
jgi:hypothetical protein